VDSVSDYGDQGSSENKSDCGTGGGSGSVDDSISTSAAASAPTPASTAGESNPSMSRPCASRTSCLDAGTRDTPDVGDGTSPRVLLHPSASGFQYGFPGFVTAGNFAGGGGGGQGGMQHAAAAAAAAAGMNLIDVGRCLMAAGSGRMHAAAATGNGNVMIGPGGPGLQSIDYNSVSMAGIERGSGGHAFGYGRL